MTTIAFRDGIMASDSMIECNGWLSPCIEVEKIRKVTNGALIGLAGNPTFFDPFCDWFLGIKNERPVLNDTMILVALPDGQLEEYTQHGKIVLSLSKPFFAIGSGTPAALGAMCAGATAERAVSIAALLDPYTGGRIQVKHLK